MTAAGARGPIGVRLAVAADAALLADLGARAFSDAFLFSTTAPDMDAYLAEAFGPGVQAGELADPERTFLIAEDEGAVAGYAQLRRGTAPACVPGRLPIEIVRFYSDAPWIGRGVGAALMQASLDLAASECRDTVWLDVWDRNHRAIAFYRKWGFAPVGNATFRIGDDVQSDLIMSRAVDCPA